MGPVQVKGLVSADTHKLTEVTVLFADLKGSLEILADRASRGVGTTGTRKVRGPAAGVGADAPSKARARPGRLRR